MSALSGLHKRIARLVGANTLEKTEEIIAKTEETIEKTVQKRVSRVSQLLLLSSILSSFLYWSSFVLPFSGYLHAVIKWLSIGTLSVIILRLINRRQDIFLLAALFCHSLGDLALAHPYQDLLMLSIGPFLMGHVFYIFTFKADLPESYQLLKQSISRGKKILIVAVIIYTAIMSSILIPPLLNTNLVIPIAIYMFIISAMVILSSLPQYRSPWMTLGCWMYIISDSLIAINKFYMPLPPVLGACTWPLYYIGQILISLGLMKEKNNSLYFLIVHDYISI